MTDQNRLDHLAIVLHGADYQHKHKVPAPDWTRVPITTKDYYRNAARLFALGLRYFAENVPLTTAMRVEQIVHKRPVATLPEAEVIAATVLHDLGRLEL